MKITATVKSYLEITAIRVSAEVRYWEDAEINGISDDADNPKIPLRNGKIWEPTIDIDTGRVRDWPTGTTADVHYKVCDQGIYELLDNSGNVVAKKDGYVPDILNTGNGYGDYIILNIGADGVITNWIAAVDPEEWKWSTPAAPAADKQEKRHMDIGRAIERACAELPEGVEISISLEHHAGTVTLIDSNGNGDDHFDHECGLAGTINQAIAAAIAAQKGGAV